MIETVVALIVGAVTVALLTAMSVRANRRFETQRDLPMQWGLNGAVISTAPRRFVLAFTPVLAAACLTGIAALTVFGRARAGQEHLVIPAILLVAFVFVGLHALHLWLIQRFVQRRG